MPDLVVSLKLKADGSGLVGEVRGSEKELEKPRRQTDQNAKAANRFEKSADSLSRRLRTFGSAAKAMTGIVAAAAAGTAVAVNRSLTLADGICKTADKLNFGVEAL